MPLDRLERAFLNIMRNWFADLREIRAAIKAHRLGERNYTAMLVYLWNWCADPRRAMTDREHAICRAAARWAMAQLRGRTGWHESDDGRLWI